MRFLMLAAACGLMTAVPAIAQDAGQTPATTTAQPEKKTCRYYNKTGSIMPGKRTCHTVKEWAAIDAQNRAAADQMTDPSRRGWGGDTRTGN